MRALIRTGPQKEILSLSSDHPEPSQEESQSGHYLIRTRATALTRGELTWPEFLVLDVPVPGYDLSGMIISAPTSTADGRSPAFKPGDEIYAMTSLSGNGNAREITVALEKELSRKPKNLSWEEAATVPLSALSAYQGLFEHGKLEPDFSGGKNLGKRVLITAGSGGVGTWAVQLAKLTGAEVVSTCGPSNVEFVKSLGADVVLDYSKTKVLEWVDSDRDAREFDVIIDCIGGQTLVEAWKCARKGAKVVGVAEPPVPKKPAEGVHESVEGIWFIVEPNSTQLDQLTELIERKSCRTFVDSVFFLEQYKEAFEKLEGGHARGKVVLKVN